MIHILLGTVKSNNSFLTSCFVVSLKLFLIGDQRSGAQPGDQRSGDQPVDQRSGDNQHHKQNSSIVLAVFSKDNAKIF
ncbi:MAG: hypothetical protein ACK5WZ_06600 [Pseudobdellovibrionaceae bacterium]